MRKLLTVESIVKKMVEVEVALSKALEKVGIAPPGSSRVVEEAAKEVSSIEVYELEKKLGHEVYALAKILESKSGPSGSHVHLGATSNDIVDTAWSLIIRDALEILESKLVRVILEFREYALKYRDYVMVGRTHGQHALPITLGFKFANYVYEFTRSFERIKSCKSRVLRGKIGGAVGTMAAWKDKGLEVERITLEMLGLEPHPIATQVAPRDGYAELGAALAILASQIERFSLEVRELSRPEIGELIEDHSGKIGSSTMPHKNNPVLAEKICGLARLIRGYSTSLLENIPLWHERDLSNSSFERVVLPHLLLAVDEILESTLKLLRILRVDSKRMIENLELTGKTNLSEAVMVKLVEKGMSRSEAYELVKKLVDKAVVEGKSLVEVLASTPEILSLMSEEEIRECLDASRYLGSYDKLIERAIRYSVKVLGR